MASCGVCPFGLSGILKHGLKVSFLGVVAFAPSVSTGVELDRFPAPGPAGSTGPAFTPPLFTWPLSLDPTALSVLQVGQELVS